MVLLGIFVRAGRDIRLLRHIVSRRRTHCRFKSRPSVLCRRARRFRRGTGVGDGTGIAYFIFASLHKVCRILHQLVLIRVPSIVVGDENLTSRQAMLLIEHGQVLREVKETFSSVFLLPSSRVCRRPFHGWLGEIFRRVVISTERLWFRLFGNEAKNRLLRVTGSSFGRVQIIQRVLNQGFSFRLERVCKRIV